MAKKSNGKAPSHRAFVVQNYTDQEGTEKSRWNEVGSAWPNDDGKGFNVILQSLPVDGKFTLRVNEPKNKDDD